MGYPHALEVRKVWWRRVYKSFYLDLTSHLSSICVNIMKPSLGSIVNLEVSYTNHYCVTGRYRARMGLE